MKLVEALMLRADYQVKIDKFKNRILSNVKIQEGEEVLEDPIGVFLLGQNDKGFNSGRGWKYE